MLWQSSIITNWKASKFLSILVFMLCIVKILNNLLFTNSFLNNILYFWYSIWFTRSPKFSKKLNFNCSSITLRISSLNICIIKTNCIMLFAFLTSFNVWKEQEKDFFIVDNICFLMAFLHSTISGELYICISQLWKNAIKIMVECSSLLSALSVRFKCLFFASGDNDFTFLSVL